ncbi:unnamed protein product [Leptosia nina]|uniref:Reverse transcriptase domain-containing protein n=1 Tax=Leptosia nina TaxID=320188 RepID=A0AAV1JDZ2_9NEOP
MGRQSQSKYVYPRWYTSELIQQIKKKAKLHKHYKSTKSVVAYREFSQCRAEVKNLIALSREQYSNCVEANIKYEPRSLWNYINDHRANRQPPEIIENGEVLSVGQSVEAFANFFSSVYAGQKPNLNVEAAIREAGSSNTVAMISVEKLQLKDVQKAMQGLKPKKATGPDRVPPYVLKDCCTVLAEPLRHIFNLSLKETIVPEVWKNSKVVPVPKGGNRSRVENYRPVAILSSPAKVMETALQRSIYSQISPYLADAQHGFRPTRSTTSNLLSYMSDIIPVVDSGGQVDAAYLDFKKAFDMVDNDILLKKFAEVGFTTHLLKLMTSLLTDRKQYVEYGGCKSKEYFTRSGVTQGSNMGPLQFLLMVNDLSGVMKNAKCLIFADDVKLSLSIENMEDCTSLQKDIDRVVLRGKLQHPEILQRLCLSVPGGNMRRRKALLLALPHAHTNLLKYAPVIRAITILNEVAIKTDLFCCTLAEFTRCFTYPISIATFISTLPTFMVTLAGCANMARPIFINQFHSTNSFTSPLAFLTLATLMNLGL